MPKYVCIWRTSFWILCSITICMFKGDLMTYGEEKCDFICHPPTNDDSPNTIGGELLFAENVMSV